VFISAGIKPLFSFSGGSIAGRIESRNGRNDMDEKDKRTLPGKRYEFLKNADFPSSQQPHY
jgi:hypothetical protein